VEEGEGKGEIKGSFKVREGGCGGVSCAEEDAVEDDDSQFEDEDVVPHWSVIIRMSALLKHRPVSLVSICRPFIDH